MESVGEEAAELLVASCGTGQDHQKSGQTALCDGFGELGGVSDYQR